MFRIAVDHTVADEIKERVMRYGRRRRFFSLLAGLPLAFSALGLTGGAASADPVPHTVCAIGGNGEANFNPPLTLLPKDTSFRAFSTPNNCQLAYTGTVAVTSLTGRGNLSCTVSTVNEGSIRLDWDGPEKTHSNGTIILAFNVSKGIAFKFRIDSGKYAGQSGTLTVESLSNTLNCASGLERIAGPTQLVFGI